MMRLFLSWVVDQRVVPTAMFCELVLGFGLLLLLQTAVTAFRVGC